MIQLISFFIFLFSTNSFADYREEYRNRGAGISYKISPIKIVKDNTVSYIQLNLISIDIFSYNLSEHKLLGGFTFHYGAKEKFVEAVGADLYFGKRVVIIPYLFDVILRAGPSLFEFNYDLSNRTIKSNHFGAFGAVSIQFSLFSGMNLYAEVEARGVSPASYKSYNIKEENYSVKFVNFVPDSVKKFNFYDIDIIQQNVRIGISFLF